MRRTAKRYRSKYDPVWERLDALKIYGSVFIDKDLMPNTRPRFLAGEYKLRSLRKVRSFTVPEGAVFVRVE